TSLPVAGSQKRIVSCPPEIRVLPSAENITERNASRLSPICSRSLPLAVSQRWITRALVAPVEASVLPSGLSARERAVQRLRNGGRRCPVAALAIVIWS